MDLAEVNAAEKLFDEINRRKLLVDVLVNNPEFGELGRFADLDGKFDVKSAYNPCQCLRVEVERSVDRFGYTCAIIRMFCLIAKQRRYANE